MKNFALVMVGFSLGAIWCACKTMHIVTTNQKIRGAVASEAADWIVSKLNL